MSEAVVIEPVREISEEVSAAFARLLPQLSSSARFDADLLAAMVAHTPMGESEIAGRIRRVRRDTNDDQGSSS